MQGPSFQIYNASAGSGKTYALAKAYLHIVLRHPGSFKRILAITFTNKAVNEMKGRIIDSLSLFASCEPKEMQDPLFLELAQQLGIGPEELKQRSQKRLKELLHNYAFFDVSTIDKFTHRLIRTFAKDLKLPQNFEVVLDNDLLLDEAINRVIAKAGQDKALSEVLIDFALEKIEDDRSWDIAYDLHKMGQHLFVEDNVPHLATLGQKPVSEFLALQAHLRKRLFSLEEEVKNNASKSLALLYGNQLEQGDFTGGYYPKFLESILADSSHLDFTAKWKSEFGSKPLYNKTTPEATKAMIDSLMPQLEEQFGQIKEAIGQQAYDKNVLKNVVPLALLHTIQNELKAVEDEKDQLSISKFNTIIANEIKNQPAPFIYERLGEKYRHYFIDEFQDTSKLQWENLVPLIAHALESQDLEGKQGSLFLVGDAKQAIYRWRGGKAEQFLHLATERSKPFSIRGKTTILPKNYRSHEEVVHFNNTFFQYTSSFLNNEAYASFFKEGNQQEPNHRKGGLVELTFLEEDTAEAYGAKTIQIIENALKAGYAYGDICILTRKKKHGAALADQLLERDIPVISPDALLLSQSPKVVFLVQLARYVLHPDKEIAFDLLSYLYRDGHDGKHDLIFKGLGNMHSLLLGSYGFSIQRFQQENLYDAFEYAIAAFDLVPFSDAHVTGFMDFVLEFSLKEGTDIQSFLRYWDKKGRSKNVSSPEHVNAVNVMTIHKSKGLEFPIVIFPYANTHMKEEMDPTLWIAVDEHDFQGFSEVMVNKKKEVRHYSAAAAAVYDEEEDKLQLDAMNLLYVALTRAIKALYIVTLNDTNNKGEYKTDHYSGLFAHYLQHTGRWKADTLVYPFGQLPQGEGGTSRSKTTSAIPYIYTDKNRASLRIVTKAGMLWDSGSDIAIRKGNIIHNILSNVHTHQDVSVALQKAIHKGLFPEKELAQMRHKVLAITEHPQLKSLFNSGNEVWNEREILMAHGPNLRPDRVVLHNGKIYIMDYKTGQRNQAHAEQVLSYANAYAQMGHAIAQKIIVYIREQINVEIL